MVGMKKYKPSNYKSGSPMEKSVHQKYLGTELRLRKKKRITIVKSNFRNSSDIQRKWGEMRKKIVNVDRKQKL